MTKKKSKRKSSTINTNPNGKLKGKLQYNHKRQSTLKRTISAAQEELSAGEYIIGDMVWFGEYPIRPTKI